MLRKSETDDEWAAMRRNQMLYVLVGDPALRPLEPLDGATTPTPARASAGRPD